jgi:hypothetical protein
MVEGFVCAIKASRLLFIAVTVQEAERNAFKYPLWLCELGNFCIPSSIKIEQSTAVFFGVWFYRAIYQSENLNPFSSVSSGE